MDLPYLFVYRGSHIFSSLVNDEGNKKLKLYLQTFVLLSETSHQSDIEIATPYRNDHLVTRLWQAC